MKRLFHRKAEDGQVGFLQAPALTTAAMAAITEPVRRRGLRWFARSGLLEPVEAHDMLGWAHGGFSLDAAVRIAGPDRAGLERLLRDGARPPFALERLEQINPHQVIGHLPKPRRDGRTTRVLTPLELIDALAAQFVQRLAATRTAPPPRPRGAGAELAAALGRHC